LDWTRVIERIEVLAGRKHPPHVTILEVRDAIREEGLQHASSDEVEALLSVLSQRNIIVAKK
jgi:hypothetical protein